MNINLRAIIDIYKDSIEFYIRIIESRSILIEYSYLHRCLMILLRRELK